MIDVGFAFGDGMFVDEPFDNYDHPDCWLVKCKNGHVMWANNDMIAAGGVSCDACARDTATLIRLRERNKEAEDLLNAGQENTAAYDALIEAARTEIL